MHLYSAAGASFQKKMFRNNEHVYTSKKIKNMLYSAAGAFAKTSVRKRYKYKNIRTHGNHKKE